MCTGREIYGAGRRTVEEETPNKDKLLPPSPPRRQDDETRDQSVVPFLRHSDFVIIYAVQCAHTFACARHVSEVCQGDGRRLRQTTQYD